MSGKRDTEKSIELARGDRVGVDVVALSRIARAMDRNIIQTICHPDELAHGPFSVYQGAKIWTAKEAVVKTLGTGFWQGGVDFPDIMVVPFESVRLTGRARLIAPRARFALCFSDLPDALIALAIRYEPDEPQIDGEQDSLVPE